MVHGDMIVSEKLIYTERVSSDRTEDLFVALMLLFFGLLTRRLVRGSRGLLRLTQPADTYVCPGFNKGERPYL
jgi:hypothetical protein